MKTFTNFREDITETATLNEDEDTPRLFPHEECPHCGQSYPEGELHHCWQSGHHNEPQHDETVKEDEIEEDAPTNNAGGGNVAGLGVGPQGEPGVSPNYQRKRKQLKLMNGPAVDPRLFADAIFSRKKPTK